MNYRYTFENILFEIMPLTATSIPSRLLHNRRSCEGAVCRNSNGKPEYDINHRSIHSDPGVCFDALSRKSDSSLISNKIMKKLEEGLQNVVMRQKHKAIENLYRLSPCFNDSQLGHDQYTPSRCGYSFKDQKLCRLDANDFSLPIERRNNNNRKAYVVDAKICDHKLCGQGRVKSTSLSSSATSLYSEEDDFIRSSVNASPVPSMTSECPSVASESLLPSYCSFLEENDKIFGHNFNQSSATVTQQTERCINNNNKTPEQRIAEINQKVLVNFCDNNREHNFDESSESTETDTYTCVLPSVPEEDSEEERSTQSREALTDQEEEELEQCALSEFWHLEEDGHRWSRLDSKASALETPSSRLSLHDQQESGESVSDVFPVDGYMRSDDSRRQWLTRGDDSLKPPNRTNLKPKHSFLKRVGGDLKKFSSFRKKEFHQRNNSIDGSIDTELLKPIKSRHDARNKSWRKRKVVIGEPTLQSGHERLDQMRCVPIDGSGIKDLQNQHRGRKNSSHSLISSSSSSGGASIASTPASRTRAFTEDFSSDMGEISPGLHGRNRALLEMNIHDNSSLRNKEPQPERDSFFVMPPGYKPGTFPSDLRERTEQDELTTAFSSPSSTSSTRSHSTSDSIQVTSDTKKSSRPMSVYDNLPEAAFNGNTSAQDIINILDPGSPFGVVDDSGVYDGSIESLEVPSQGIDNAFWSVDDIVEHTQSLQQMVGAWDEDTSDEKSDVAETRSTDSNLNAGEVLPSYSSENVSTTEDDAETQVLSGEQRPQSCLRWESLRRTSFGVSDIDESLQLHNLSVGQLMILRRLSVLKLTALMESYAFSNSKGALNWSVPRFIKRIKVPDYKEKSVFGVPLLHNVQRFGQPLPLCIQHALAYLRRTAMDQVGLFRKPGVKSRIQLLSEKCETNPDWSNFDDCSAYDVGDMVKKYFRDLPDPLMTMKMSDTFIGIFLYVPDELRLKAVQAAIMLLPDETRETLKTLLAFLSDFASFSSENHMNSSNLATCFAPSLFYQQFTSARLVNTSSSPKIRKSQGGKNLSMSLGRPEMREMHDNKAANLCLAFMINHVKDLFMISEDAMTQCRMSVMQQPEDVLASEIGYASDFQDEEFLADYHLYVDRMVAQMLREEQRISQNKGGWQNVVSSNGTELLCKKINDGNPLRLWRSKVEVTGSDPHQIMERILNERHLWDDDLIQWKVLQQPDERTQLYQTVRSEMSPHPTRDYCVLRSWRNGVTSRGGVSVIETSTGQQTLLGDVRGVVLTSRYLIEPTDVANKCTITHMCRVDTKGRNPEWYNKAYGHVITQQLLNIGESLVTSPSKLTSTSS